MKPHAEDLEPPRRFWKFFSPRPVTQAGVLAVALLALALGPGCRTPMGAEQVPPGRVYRELRGSALDGGAYSAATRAILHRYDAEKTFRARPAKTLWELRDRVLLDPRHDLLLALAELNYFHAEHLRHSVKPGEHRQARDYFLASSLYAYWYWVAETSEAKSGFYGPQLELARECYNRALAQGLLAPGATNAVVRLEAGIRQLPGGPVEVRLNTNAFPWSLSQFAEFVMADAYAVKGLSVRNRQAGLGAPLIATAARRASDFGPVRVPATVFLRVEGGLQEWNAGRAKLSLEIYPGYQDASVEVAGRRVPLEVDATAPLAYALNNPALRKLGRRQFFSGREIMQSGIYRLQPYQAGAVPVVFVHGTFSSPICWAEMWNTLESDPVLSRRCQLWAFIYNSGNPVAWSAANLRDALTETVNKLDPKGADPALRQIVVIGHSQGGLLAKLTVVHTGDKLWRAVSDKNLDALQLPENVRAQLQRTLFVEPVPSVKRVIFVATPHRGSFRATGLARRIAARLVSLPVGVLRYVQDVAQAGGRGRLPALLRKRMPTSLDSMSPENPTMLALAELPPVAGVTCHSIIAVKGNGPVEKGNDGIVAFPSAHVSYAESELIVHGSHSCENEPPVIEEVRRILLAHLANLDQSRPYARNGK